MCGHKTSHMLYLLHLCLTKGIHTIIKLSHQAICFGGTPLRGLNPPLICILYITIALIHLSCSVAHPATILLKFGLDAHALQCKIIGTLTLHLKCHTARIYKEAHLVHIIKYKRSISQIR